MFNQKLCGRWNEYRPKQRRQPSHRYLRLHLEEYLVVRRRQQKVPRHQRADRDLYVFMDFRGWRTRAQWLLGQWYISYLEVIRVFMAYSYIMDNTPPFTAILVAFVSHEEILGIQPCRGPLVPSGHIPVDRHVHMLIDDSSSILSPASHPVFTRS